jgi:MFS family permease
MSCSRMVAWSIWFIAAIFYAYQYVLRVMPNILMPDIMQQFDIGAGVFGQFSGVYYIGYSLMHLPLGIMLDHYGPRKTMTACILLSVVGMLPLIASHHWIYPVVGRFLLGMGSSAAILGLFKIIRMGFNEERFPRMLSLAVTIGLLGAIYGGGPMSYMRNSLGYETVVQLFILMGIILAAVTYWLVPEITTPAQTNIKADIGAVLSNRRVMGCCLFAGLMVGPLEGFADVWGTAFLQQVYGFDAGTAASLASLVFIGMCFGAPVLNLIASRVGNYLVTVVAAGTIMVGSFCTLLLWQLQSEMLSFSFIIIGICSAYQILAIYKASTYVPENIAGLTTAVANMIIMIFGYAFHTVMGAVINSMGGAGSTDALIYGVAVIPIALTIGTLGFALLLTTEKFKVPATADL